MLLYSDLKYVMSGSLKAVYLRNANAPLDVFREVTGLGHCEAESRGDPIL